jgi:hypothetical protein
MWDFVMDKSGTGAGFLRELRFPLPIYIPSAFTQSSSLSPEAGTKARSSRSANSLTNKIKKKSYCRVMFPFCILLKWKWSVSCFRRYVFVGLPDSAELVWNSLLMPFSSALWMALLLSPLALSALLCLTTKLSHRHGSQLDGKEPKFSFLQSLFCVFSAFCSQGKRTVSLGRNEIILVYKLVMGSSSKPCVTYHNIVF